MAEIVVVVGARRKGAGQAWGIVHHHVVANRKMEVYESKVIIDMDMESDIAEYLEKLKERARVFAQTRGLQANFG